MKEKDVKLSGGLEKQQTQKLIVTGQNLDIQFLISYCLVNVKQLSAYHNSIEIKEIYRQNCIEIQEIYRHENTLNISLEVVDAKTGFYSVIFKWNFDKIESFYKESKIKLMLKASSVDKSIEVSWLDPFFKYYNDKKEELSHNLSSKDKLYLLQNEIYNEIEQKIYSYSNNYLRSRNILETNMIQSCIQSWDGKLEKSDIVRGTGIELRSVHNMIESLKNDGIVQEQENSKLGCLKRKFSDDAVRAMRKRANNISQ